MAKRKKEPEPQPRTWADDGPGRKTDLTVPIIEEVARSISLGASMKDALLTAGVPVRTGCRWLSDGEKLAADPDFTPRPGTNDNLRWRFWHAIERAKAMRRSMIKGLIARAAQGQGGKPGDWRAAQAFGAITDPRAFVPDTRVQVLRELEEAVRRLMAAFTACRLQVLSPQEALELAVNAISGEELGSSDGEDEALPTEPVM
jgi:hypothetical protein